VRVHVAFTPGEAAPVPTGIVVDVLRATSTIVQALHSGYEAVYCCAEIEEAKALEGELGKLGKARQQERAADIVSLARDVGGVRLVTADEEADADELRALAQDVANRLEGSDGAAVVLGTGRGGKALLVAAASKNLVARGVTAPELLEPAAKLVGGGAGGKPTLAFSGGPDGDASTEALKAIEPRLKELLGER